MIFNHSPDSAHAKLFEYPPKINLRTAWRATPLHLAAKQENKRIVLCLLMHGASVNQADNRGWTPLHIAAINGNKHVAKVLLEHGAAWDTKDTWGKTPLDYAVLCNKKSIIHLIARLRCKTARLTFCEVLHPRLGATSPANILSPYLLPEIVKHAHRQDFRSIAHADS